MITFSPFPIIETKNLFLRRMANDDIYDIFELRRDPKMIEYTDSRLDENSEETKSYIDKMNKGIEEGKWIVWAIEHRQSNKVIGTISIWNINLEQRSAELGYGITPDYQNKSLMKEALLSVVDYGFNAMNLSALEAYTEEKNAKSIKLLERCRFIEVNRVDDEGYYSDRIYHMVVYRLEKINR